MEIELILKAFLIGWWLSYFTPLQDFLDKRIKPHLSSEYLKTALSCITCLSFWAGLLIYQDFFVGSSAAVLAYVFSKIINSIRINL